MIYYLVLLLFTVEYLRPGNVWPVVNVARLNTIIPLLALSLTAVSGAVPNRDVLRDRNTSFLLAWLGLIVMSVLTARVTAYAFDTFTMVLGYVLLAWVVARQMGDVSRLKGLFKTMIAIHITILVIAPEIVTDASTRHYIPAGAFLGDGNDFALSVDILVPLALFLLFESTKWRQKAFYAALLLLLVAAIVGTQSRGGTLGLVAVAIYYWLKTDRKVLTGALAGTALVGVMALASPQYFARMGTIATYDTDGSAQGRITAWKAGVGMMLSNPVLGVGAGNFPPNFTRFAPGAGGVGRWKTAHSIYFLVLGELGLPGFGLLIYFIVWNLNANRRLSKQLVKQGVSARSSEVRLLGCLSASLIAFAVAGAFLSAVYYPHMYVLAGMLAAGRRIARETVAVPVPVTPVRAPVVAHPPALRRIPRGRYVS